MNTRVPSLLASLALGIVALTGCSIHSDAAAGDLDNRVPMAQAGATEPGANPAATVGQVTVTPLSKADFDDQRHVGKCTGWDALTFCQNLQSHGVGSSAYVTWTAFVGVPQDTVHATMSVVDYTATVQAASPYVKLEWNSPNIPAVTLLGTDVRITLDDGTTYSANCYCTYDGRGMYDEEELVVQPS
jgi:hypothetical protein